MITTVKEGLESTPGVTLTRGMAWIVEGKLNYRNDPAMKGKDPGMFKMYAVPLPKQVTQWRHLSWIRTAVWTLQK